MVIVTQRFDRIGAEIGARIQNRPLSADEESLIRQERLPSWDQGCQPYEYRVGLTLGSFSDLDLRS